MDERGEAATDLLVAATGQLRDAASTTARVPEEQRPAAWRELLAGPVHDALMRARTDGGEQMPGALGDLAGTVRDHVPAGIEDGLPTRVRVLVALLRRGALEPAWMLAQDNASGRVRPARTTATWAGGTNLTTALPLPTLTERGHVFAWLPGFRDPRWGVPDEVYDMDRSVMLRHRLDEVSVRGGVLLLRGVAYLSELTAGPDDRVALVLHGPSAEQHRMPAVRGRRPDLVTSQGPGLTGLAWGGWRAKLVPEAIAGTAGEWLASIEVELGGVSRSAPLGAERGPLADPRWPGPELRCPDGSTLVCGSGPDGRLVLEVTGS